MTEPKLHDGWELVMNTAAPVYRMRVPGGWIYNNAADRWAVFVPAPPDPPRPGE